MENIENKKTQNNKNNSKKTLKNKNKSKNLAQNSKYFDFYDDIKVGGHKIVDW